jgi:hypothetical protein
MEGGKKAAHAAFFFALRCGEVLPVEKLKSP